MLFSTAGQAQVFLVTVALGSAMGVTYDIVALLCALLKKESFHWLLEGTFFVFAALAAFFVLVRLNGGDVRGYTLLGMGVGWCLYLLSLSPLFRKLCARLCARLKTIGNNRFFRSLLR